MQFIRPALLATTILTASMTTAFADVRVVTSIKPVHSLVAAVMQGVRTPDLIVEGAGSPHTYALKPSQAKQLQEADIVFWMSQDLEAFLEKSIDGIATKAVSVPLMESRGLMTLGFREGGAFDDHGHDEHDDHDKHVKDDDHDHEKHDDHDDHEKHNEHDHGEVDPHVWLDPENAKAMVHEIEEALAKADPANAATYELSLIHI